MSGISPPAGRSVLMLISSLTGGGAERAMTELANFLTRRGWQVDIVTFDAQGSVDFYPLDSAVVRRRISVSPSRPSSLFHRLLGNVRRIAAIRRTLRAQPPDVALAFMDTANVLLILAARGLRVPTVIAERIDPAMNTTVTRPWRIARRIFYRHADADVAQTRAAAEWLRQECTVHPHVIANALRALPAPPNTREPLVLSVGRLEHQKGFDVLLKAFSAAHAAFPRWRLAIVGDGPLRGSLEALAGELGLSEVVDFLGRRADIEQWYARASVVAQASRFEGFPNVVLEAMGMGAAVISTDCRSGPRELISDGDNGVLVPVDDVDALADALCSLLGDADRRRRLGQAALHVREQFSAQQVLPRWETLLTHPRLDCAR
jgi:GalNAc-alpha-(1->4)-GalNAc-alpha-(1->3)-diNAcBac-PP-undecaprenol alpha-1,4-N-acetyl-D-galactosaminyltransferase